MAGGHADEVFVELGTSVLRTETTCIHWSNSPSATLISKVLDRYMYMYISLRVPCRIENRESLVGRGHDTTYIHVVKHYGHYSGTVFSVTRSYKAESI